MDVDSADNLYVADYSTHYVLKITPDGTLSIFAGDGTAGAPTPGPATDSAVDDPLGIAVDADDSLYVTDAVQHQVFKITSDGTLSIFAGTGVNGPLVEGPAGSSTFANPNGIAIDPAGIVYVGDQGRRQVARIDTLGDLTVYAGTGASAALLEGPATASPIGMPMGLETDSDGNLYFADAINNQVARIDTSGDLTIYAGDGTTGDAVPGPAADSPLTTPIELATDAYDRLYIADYQNRTVDRVTGTDRPEAPGTLVPDPGDGEFDVTFTPGDEGSAPVTGYEVSLDNCTTWDTLATVPGPGPTEIGTVTGLADGTYQVCVGAVSDVGDGEPSDMAQVQIGPSATVPGRPTGLHATAKNGGARLWWMPPASNGGSPVRGYQIDLHDSGQWVNLVISAAPHGERTAVLSGLRNGGTYKPRVRAVNGVGAGPASAMVTIKPHR